MNPTPLYQIRNLLREMMSKVASVWELFSLKYVTGAVRFIEFNEGGTLRIIVSCKLRLGNKQTANNDTDYFLRGL